MYPAKATKRGWLKYQFLMAVIAARKVVYIRLGSRRITGRTACGRHGIDGCCFLSFTPVSLARILPTPLSPAPALALILGVIDVLGCLAI